MPPKPRHLLVLAAALLAAAVARALPPLQDHARFAETIAQLSEAGGHFDSNNLISNEKSYLHVIPALRAARMSGGAYVGVGPDQNFSYIAHARPSIAFIVDVRRDNLLLHLLFKALFRLAPSRADYLGLLFGRGVPAAAGRAGEDIERIARYLEAPPLPAEAIAELRARVQGVVRSFGVPLSDADNDTIDRFHRVFIERGLGLQFESAGRPPRRFYPTYRELLLETDRAGRRGNYLASDEDFGFVRSLQERDLVIPVVGDLAGERALRAVARFIDGRGERLSVFYASNVEYYLATDGSLERFVENLRQFPHGERSLIIRSVFPSQFGWYPPAPGYHSASLVQRVDDLLRGFATGRLRSYEDLLVSREAE